MLREIFEFAQKENLSASLSGEGAVSLLSEAWRDWRLDATEVAPTLHDAVMAMQLLEHSLRPLSHPPVRADVAHAVTNGLGALPALAAKWRYGTPMVVTEHGIYMREQYMHSRNAPFRWPVRALHLRFLRRLCSLGYHEAEIITPGNVYNKRWEEQLSTTCPVSARSTTGWTRPISRPPRADPETPTISSASTSSRSRTWRRCCSRSRSCTGRCPRPGCACSGRRPPARRPTWNAARRWRPSWASPTSATFEGRVDQIRDAYDAGQIVVLCSISEGFPYTLIEAMTCGRPCVATDVGGVTEAVADTGMIVPAAQPRGPGAGLPGAAAGPGPAAASWGPRPGCGRWSTSPSTARSARSTRSTRSSAPASRCRPRSGTTSRTTCCVTGLPGRDEETELLEAAG